MLFENPVVVVCDNPSSSYKSKQINHLSVFNLGCERASFPKQGNEIRIGKKMALLTP